MPTSTNIKAAVKTTPEVLFWARETAGMSPEEVLGKLKLKRLSEKTIAEWESGESEPSYAQLEKLAKIYQRPVAIFFFPAPPPEPREKEKFRSLPEAQAEQIPTRIRFLVRNGLVRQINLRELFDEVNPAETKIFKDIKASNNISATQLAKQVRDYIGISLNEQFSWKDSAAAFKSWRNALEESGLWIFKNAFKEGSYSGFCLHDEQFPIIYVNNSMPPPRQIFTLFHELAHLLRGMGGIDILQDAIPKLTGPYKQEEVFCNAFAGAILVPEETFPAGLNSPDTQQIQSLVEKYQVSRGVILRKLYDTGRISQNEYEDRIEQWGKEPPSNRASSPGVNYYATQRTYLGDRYLNIAFQRYHQQRITRRELADYLGIKKMETLDNFENHLIGEWQ